MLKKIALICTIICIQAVCSDRGQAIEGTVVGNDFQNGLITTVLFQQNIIKRLGEELKRKDREIAQYKKEIEGSKSSILACDCNTKENIALGGLCCISFICLKCLLG